MPFVKGVSGNPGGRTKGLTAAVKAKAGADGKKLIDALWLIATGKPDAIEAAYGATPSIRDRQSAIDSLLDRGFGKATQTIAGDEDQPVALKVIFGGRHKAA